MLDLVDHQTHKVLIQSFPCLDYSFAREPWPAVVLGRSSGSAEFVVSAHVLLAPEAQHLAEDSVAVGSAVDWVAAVGPLAAAFVVVDSVPAVVAAADSEEVVEGLVEAEGFLEFGEGLE